MASSDAEGSMLIRISPNETDSDDGGHDLRESGISSLGRRWEAGSCSMSVLGCCKETITGSEMLFRTSSFNRRFQ